MTYADILECLKTIQKIINNNYQDPNNEVKEKCIDKLDLKISYKQLKESKIYRILQKLEKIEIKGNKEELKKMLELLEEIKNNKNEKIKKLVKNFKNKIENKITELENQEKKDELKI